MFVRQDIYKKRMAAKMVANKAATDGDCATLPAAVTGADGLSGGAVEVMKPVVPDALTVPLPGAVIDGAVLETEGSDEADGEDETDAGLVEVAVADDTPIADELVLDDDSTALDDTAEDDDTADEDGAVETAEEVSETAVLDAEEEEVRTSEEDETTGAAEDETTADSEEETGG